MSDTSLSNEKSKFTKGFRHEISALSTVYAFDAKLPYAIAREINI